MSPSPTIVSFRDPVAAEVSHPDAARLLAGAPRISTWNHYAADQCFFAGVWAASRGRWQVRYTEHEFCHLLEGRVAIVAADGTRYEFGPGDSFVIPAGFDGTWEVLEDCRKLYAVYQRAGDAG